MRMIKKLKAGVLVLALTAGMMTAASVSAAEPHIKPGTGTDLNNPAVYCDNTYRTYRHSDFKGSSQYGEHLVSGGVLCKVTGLSYDHNIYCSSCGKYMSSRAYGCTIAHSSCGSQTVNHPAY
ncbi:MAG: hypothetical protein K2N94_03595 [Lachnospiraceae bacterium]|nr:hypothetical protein [Lachnospiraceae bacterium]